MPNARPEAPALREGERTTAANPFGIAASRPTAPDIVVAVPEGRDDRDRHGETTGPEAPVHAASRPAMIAATSLDGGLPKVRAYSRLNWVGLS